MGAEFIVTLIVALFILLIAMCIGTAFTTPFHGAVIRLAGTPFDMSTNSLLSKRRCGFAD